MKTSFLKPTGLFFVAILLGLPLQSSALEIKYASTYEGGDNWRLDYTLIGQEGDASVREFSIFFDRLRYGTLSLLGSPAGWDTIVVQADQSLAADGFLDSLALEGGLAPGQQLSGLSLSITSLVPRAPTAQLFEVIDPDSFAVLDRGFTIPATSSPVDVPEPDGFATFALTLLAMLFASRVLLRNGA